MSFRLLAGKSTVFFAMCKADGAYGLPCVREPFAQLVGDGLQSWLQEHDQQQSGDGLFSAAIWLQDLGSCVGEAYIAKLARNEKWELKMCEYVVNDLGGFQQDLCKTAAPFFAGEAGVVLPEALVMTNRCFTVVDVDSAAAPSHVKAAVEFFSRPVNKVLKKELGRLRRVGGVY